MITRFYWNVSTCKRDMLFNSQIQNSCQRNRELSSSKQERYSVKYTFLTSVFLGKLLSHRSYCINPIIGFIEEGKMRFTISIFSVFMLCLSIMEMWHLKLLNIFQFYSLQGRKLGLCKLTILCIISQRENNCGRVLHLRKHFATCTNIHNDGKLVWRSAYKLFWRIREGNDTKDFGKS